MIISRPALLAALLWAESIPSAAASAASAAAAAAAAASPAATATSSMGEQQRHVTRTPTGGLAIPILPHHAILDRRRRELRTLGLTESEATAHLQELESARKEGRVRPSQYPRVRSDQSPAAAGPFNDDGSHRSLESHQQVGALYQGYGTHYVDVWVGTPYQRQTVIVDTGSGVTAFPCSGCNNCGESYHTDSYFIEADSSSFKKLGCDACFRGRCSGSGSNRFCRISMSYQEGSSWSAYEAVDVAYAGGPHDEPLPSNVDWSAAQTAGMDGADPRHASSFSFPLTFGCQTSLTGLFRTQLADGIMGMDNADASFWKQMHTKKAIPVRKFSLCFNRQPIASRDGTMAGAVTLGGEDPRLHSSQMVYANNVRNSGFYTVKLKKMYLREGGGESANLNDAGGMDKIKVINVDEATLNSGGVIVDSGTTDTYMSRRIAGPFKKEWEALAGRKYSHDPVTLTDAELRSLPTVLLQLSASTDGANDPANLPDDFDGTGLAGDLDPSNPKDVLVAIPATHYMEYDSDKGNYVNRLYLEEGSGSVLGANAMMGHDVLFDIDGGRIGFAESECDYFGLIGVEPLNPEQGAGQVDSEKKSEEGFDDVDPGEPTEAGAAGVGGDEAVVPYKGGDGAGGVADDDGVCPTIGCKLGVVSIVAAVVLVVVALRRRRYDGMEVMMVDPDDLDLTEEVDGAGGYADPPGGYSDDAGPGAAGAETELSDIGDGKEYRDDEERRSDFQIT